jgi:hypothetical protein
VFEVKAEVKAEVKLEEEVEELSGKHLGFLLIDYL